MQASDVDRVRVFSGHKLDIIWSFSGQIGEMSRKKRAAILCDNVAELSRRCRIGSFCGEGALEHAVFPFCVALIDQNSPKNFGQLPDFAPIDQKIRQIFCLSNQYARIDQNI